MNDNEPTITPAAAKGLDERYAPLDELGRCGVAMAVVSRDTMPTEERGSIGMVKPSGWHTVRYDDLISGRYLYNRCHLIAYELTAENANEENLITGTRYMNVSGMLPFENEVADFVRDGGGRVLYRSELVFVGDELVARGVHLQALSLDDGGAGISFNVYCYNVQPGVIIDYATGESRREDGKPASTSTSNSEKSSKSSSSKGSSSGDGSGRSKATVTSAEGSYILNTNTRKFHLPGCRHTKRMAEKNTRRESGSREDIIAQGYEPCRVCNP